MPYILALDQGTTSSRAIVFDHDGGIGAVAQKEFRQIFPQPGWVEHDPGEIWASQIGVAVEALGRAQVRPRDIAAIGITNQRETTIVWDRETGEPVYNAIVWQDRRTAEFCDRLKADGHEAIVQPEDRPASSTPIFPAARSLDARQRAGRARTRAEAGKLAFGTVDSWLVWKLTGGATHVTDVSNASRTMLFNIHTLEWDDELLRLFGVPASMLPEVRASSEVYGASSTSAGRGRRADCRHRRRSAGGALRPDVPSARACRRTPTAPAASCCRTSARRRSRRRNQLVTTVAWQIGGAPSTRSRAACSSAARWCSGSATASG